MLFRSAEEVLPERYEKEDIHADVIVIDPPRKGCSPDLLHTIADMNPDRLVYVSCNSATLARDAAILKELGYIPRRLQAVDMFPRTAHVECVTLMTRTEQ